jgi:hypothetical protein
VARTSPAELIDIRTHTHTHLVFFLYLLDWLLYFGLTEVLFALPPLFFVWFIIIIIIIIMIIAATNVGVGR